MCTPLDRVPDYPREHGTRLVRAPPRVAAETIGRGWAAVSGIKCLCLSLNPPIAGLRLIGNGVEGARSSAAGPARHGAGRRALVVWRHGRVDFTALSERMAHAAGACRPCGG